MYLNHRTDAALWQRAMARDDALASVAISAATPDEDDYRPPLNEFGVPLTQHCQHGPESWCRHCDTPDPWEDDCA